MRAVQSTPLVGASGQLLGVLSTYYRKPGPLSAAKLLALDQVTEEYAARLERNGARILPEHHDIRRSA